MKIIRSNKQRVIATCLIILILILLAGCANNSSNGILSEKLRVCASIFPMYEFVGMIGGDKIDVDIIVPPGGEAHDFELNIKSAKRLSDSDCLFYLGGYIDDWVDQHKKTGQNDDMTYVQIADFHDERHYQNLYSDLHEDSHTWLDPKNVSLMLSAICDALAELDPANADYYLENLHYNLSRLEELDAAYKEKLSSHAGKTIIVAHSAYGYLCDAYGIVELAVSGLDAGEPSPGRIAKIVDFIRSNSITHIYFENLAGEGASYAIAEILENETGAVMFELNPFENNESMSQDDDYFSVMYGNLKNILEGFK